MAEIKTKRGYKRIWLNPKKGLVNADYGFTKWNSYNAEALITIRDCTRSIALEFNFTSKEELKDKVYKLDKLIELLQTFKKEVLIDK